MSLFKGILIGAVIVFGTSAFADAKELNGKNAEMVFNNPVVKALQEQTRSEAGGEMTCTAKELSYSGDSDMGSISVEFICHGTGSVLTTIEGDIFSGEFYITSVKVIRAG